MSDAAFDTRASTYDEVAESALGCVLRGRVHERLEASVGAGTRLLDLGCGTGLDAAWADARGASVTMRDASAAMMQIAAARVPLADAAVSDLNDASWVAAASGPHDIALCNFGVVNCIADLQLFAAQLREVTTEDGVVVLVSMGRFVPWEQLPALLRLDFRTARRRLRSGPEHPEGYGELAVRYPSTRSLGAAMSGWRVEDVTSLGWVLPTYDRRGMVEHRPRALAALARLDAAGAGVASKIGLGDHHVIVLRRAR